jgi:flagellar hook-associated protein 3 FlgL
MQFNQSLNGILNAQQRMTKAESQLSKQTRILSPADDPAGAAKVLSLDQSKTQIEQYQTNSTLLKNNLALQETVLTSMRTSYDRISTLAIASANGTYTEVDRQAIALELKNIQIELFDLMNTRSPDGAYLFSGYQDRSPAYELNTSTGLYEFKGDDGARALQISSSIALNTTESGKTIFDDVFKRFKPTAVSLSSGDAAGAAVKVIDQGRFNSFFNQNYDNLDSSNNNYSFEIDASNNYQILKNGAQLNPPVTGTYSPGETVNFNGLSITIDTPITLPLQLDFSLTPPEKTNILNTLETFIASLSNPLITTEELNESLADVLVQTESSAIRIDSTLAGIGGKQNVVDSVFNTNADLLINNQQYKADISEVDLAAALTEIKRQEVALQAASQTFQKVNATTLFDYIR